MKEAVEDNSVKQIVLGALFLTFLAIIVGVVLMGSRFLPGVFGEWLGMMVGLMTTPVFLEISAFLIGLMVVFGFNHWREKRAGDEFVDLEEVADRPVGASTDEPDHAITYLGFLDRLDVGSPAMRDEVPMNRKFFIKMANGDPEGFKNLAFEFFNDMRRMMTGWGALVADGNYGQLRDELHRCKGGASLFGLELLVKMIAECEAPQEIERHGFDLVSFENEITRAESLVLELVDGGVTVG